MSEVVRSSRKRKSEWGVEMGSRKGRVEGGLLRLLPRLLMMRNEHDVN